MVFSIADEIVALRDESEWQENEKNTRTLAKDVDFRAILTVMHTGATIDEQDGEVGAWILPAHDAPVKRSPRRGGDPGGLGPRCPGGPAAGARSAPAGPSRR